MVRGKKQKAEKDKKKVKQIVQQVEEGPDEVIEPDRGVIPSGTDLLDLVLGGGYPIGKIVNIVGDKSSGKTLLAIEAVATAYRIYGKKLKWFYDDAEAGFSFNTKALYGIDIVAPDDECSNTLEDFERNLSNQLAKLKGDQILIYILDSLDSLTTEADIKLYNANKKAVEKGEEEKGSYGLLKQKKLSEFFRMQKRKLKDHNCLLIIISQVRMNIGVMFGEKYTRTGGKALDFYASQILWLAEAQKLLKKKVPAGVTIKVRTKKNKIANPFRECFIDAWFDYGLDNIMTNINYLYDLKTDLGKSKDTDTIQYKGKEYSVRKFIRHIEKNNLEEEMKKKVTAKWIEFQESISSKERKKKWKE